MIGRALENPLSKEVQAADLDHLTHLVFSITARQLFPKQLPRKHSIRHFSRRSPAIHQSTERGQKKTYRVRSHWWLEVFKACHRASKEQRRTSLRPRVENIAAAIGEYTQGCSHIHGFGNPTAFEKLRERIAGHNFTILSHVRFFPVSHSALLLTWTR